MNPRISVIIPSYNQAEFLEDAIESAYNQTKPAHEIIIVDDGSTDNSLEIAVRYMFQKFPGIESPVKVIAQTNKGLPSARNTAIMAATGDYILPLDADDMMKENAIQEFTNNILRFPNSDILAPSFECFGLKNENIILGPFGLEDLKTANRLGYFSVIKKNALLECGGYNPKMRWGFEDWDLWFEMFKRGKNFLVIQDILMRYRIKENSMLTESNKHSDELIGQIRRNHPQLFT